MSDAAQQYSRQLAAQRSLENGQNSNPDSSKSMGHTEVEGGGMFVTGGMFTGSLDDSLQHSIQIGLEGSSIDNSGLFPKINENGALKTKVTESAGGVLENNSIRGMQQVASDVTFQPHSGHNFSPATAANHIQDQSFLGATPGGH